MLDKFKGAWKSWVIWFNGISGTILAGWPAAADAFPALENYLDHKFYQILGAVVIGVNVLLRFKTNKPLDEK